MDNHLIQQLSLLKQVYNSRSFYDEECKASIHPIPKNITQSDLNLLKSYGHLPNQLVRHDHNTILSNLQELTKTWTLEEAASVFIAGLWSAPFYWRSPLMAKLMSGVMPQHDYTPYSKESQICPICGFHNHVLDTTLQWYSSFASGTPLDGDPVGLVLNLEEINKAEQRPTPTEFDCWTFRAILTVIRNLPPKARYSKVRDILKKEGLLPIKATWAYGSLLETLALIGILDTPSHPGLAKEFTTYKQRDQRPNMRVEVQAPLAWWDSSIGINEEALNQLFSAFDCSSVSLKDRAEPIPDAKKTIIGMLDKAKSTQSTIPKKSETAGKGPIEAGDVYAIRIRDGVWITAFCHEVKTGRMLYAKMEFLDGVFKEMPTKDQLISAFKGRVDGRWQQWCSSMDKTSWVRRIVRNFPTPKSNEAEPDRIPSGGAKDLFHLVDWCFADLRKN